MANENRVPGSAEQHEIAMHIATKYADSKETDSYKEYYKSFMEAYYYVKGSLKAESAEVVQNRNRSKLPNF